LNERYDNANVVTSPNLSKGEVRLNERFYSVFFKGIGPFLKPNRIIPFFFMQHLALFVY